MKPAVQNRDQWENEYQSGLWQGLHSDREAARYHVVAGYLQRGARPVSILDIGCGEGVILKYLDLDRARKYTGIDLAQAALDRITPRRPQDRTICSTLEDYSPDDTWDVVLFNEVLYYTPDPVAQLKKFEHALAPGGWFVVSMHRKSNPLAWNNRCIRSVWRYVRQAGYAIDDAVVLSKSDRSASWEVFAVRPPAR